MFLFLHTDDFWRDFITYKSKGTVFIREPAEQSIRHGCGIQRPVRQSMGPAGTEAMKA